jgi:hypothetical protein
LNRSLFWSFILHSVSTGWRLVKHDPKFS